jgi:hypothetical protein
MNVPFLEAKSADDCMAGGTWEPLWQEEAAARCADSLGSVLNPRPQERPLVPVD